MVNKQNDGLTEELLKEQVFRLKGLARGDDRPWGDDQTTGLRDEFLRILWSQAHSMSHARMIIDTLIENARTFCPAPGEIIAVADMLAVRMQPAPPSYKPIPRDQLCPTCESWGSHLQDGVYVRCLNCKNGEDSEDLRGFIELRNSFLKKSQAPAVSGRRAGPLPKRNDAGCVKIERVTQADVDKVMGERDNAR